MKKLVKESLNEKGPLIAKEEFLSKEELRFRKAAEAFMRKLADEGEEVPEDTTEVLCDIIVEIAENISFLAGRGEPHP
jgi:hypothetical protein